MTPPRLVALIVNYDSGPFSLACARSLRHEWWLHGGRGDGLDIVVWDNGSGEGQGPWLQALQNEGVRVFGSRENLGLAAAWQQAYDETCGGPDDYQALVHPDVVLVPGSLGVMLKFLEAHPECGMVSPRQLLDGQGQFQVVGRARAGGLSELEGNLCRLSPRLEALVSRVRWPAVVRELSAELPYESVELNGGLLLMPRQVVVDLGQLMDAGFPLFYEEADLCRRVRARGLSLVVHPRALALHACGRSRAGQTEESQQRRRILSRRCFLARHANPIERRLVALSEALMDRRGGAAVDCEPLRYRGCESRWAPPSLELPVGGPWLLELARGEQRRPWLAGMAQDGPWHFSLAAWEWLEPGSYNLRVRRVRDGKLLGNWGYAKTSPARVEPFWDPRKLGVDLHTGVAEAIQLAGVKTSVLREVA